MVPFIHNALRRAWQHDRVKKMNTMTKAVFLDYTGTMVKEDEPYTRELISYFIKNSALSSPKEVLELVWRRIKEIESASYGDDFIKNDEKVDRVIAYCREHCGLSGDSAYIHEVWRKVWIHAPLYEDVKPFFERTKLPIYIISNDDLCYLQESIRLKDLHPAGIISADSVRACKPHRAIFEKALSEAGVLPGEAVMIGDSLTSDIEPAKLLRIRPVYISRKGSVRIDGVTVIRSLDEYM